MKLGQLILIAVPLILVLSNAYGQTPLKAAGKNSLEITGLANVPFLSGAFNQENYYERDGEIVGRQDVIDYGLNLRYTHQFSKRIRLGMDCISRRFEVFTDRVYSSSFKNDILGSFNLTTNYRVESIAMEHLTIQPILVYSSPSSIIGSGIENTFGIGLTMYRPKRKSYAYSLTDYSTNESSWTAADNYYLDHNWSLNYAITFQYGISLSIPINPSFLFKIGTSTLLNIYFKPDFLELEDVEVDLFNLENIYYNTQRENFITWNLQSGIVYRF